MVNADEMLKKLVSSYKTCVSGGRPDRCDDCSYRGSACAYRLRRDAVKLLKSLKRDSISFRAIRYEIIDGHKPDVIECYRPVFSFMTYEDRKMEYLYTDARRRHQVAYRNAEFADFRRENIIQGISCCHPEDENMHCPDKCQECPYHDTRCTDFLDLDTLAFLMSIEPTDIDEAALAIAYQPVHESESNIDDLDICEDLDLCDLAND